MFELAQCMCYNLDNLGDNLPCLLKWEIYFHEAASIVNATNWIQAILKARQP